jgi:hypothetical protein
LLHGVDRPALLRIPRRSRQSRLVGTLGYLGLALLPDVEGRLFDIPFASPGNAFFSRFNLCAQMLGFLIGLFPKFTLEQCSASFILAECLVMLAG